MKIRTDFVTNSSSSSFVTIHIKSKKMSDFLTTKIEQIEEYNHGWCDIAIEINDNSISIEGGDRDALFIDAPTKLENFFKILFEEVLPLQNDEECSQFLHSIRPTEDIDEISWCSETYGLDGDNGRFDKSFYDPQKLQELLEDIADINSCNVDKVTDEMFYNYVCPDIDDVVEYATYRYNKENKLSSYHYETIMKEINSKTNEE